MPDLETFWKDAPGDCYVCVNAKITKKMVLNAIINGAKDLDSLKKTLSLCSDNKCSAINPSGCGCEENAESLLSTYLPIYEFMLEGDDHKSHTVTAASSCCEKTGSNDCENCQGCNS